MSEISFEQKIMALEGNLSWVDFAKYGIRHSVNEEDGKLVCTTEIYSKPFGETSVHSVQIDPPNFFEKNHE